MVASVESCPTSVSAIGWTWVDWRVEETAGGVGLGVSSSVVLAIRLNFLCRYLLWSVETAAIAFLGAAATAGNAMADDTIVAGVLAIDSAGDLGGGFVSETLAPLDSEAVFRTNSGGRRLTNVFALDVVLAIVCGGFSSAAETPENN